MISICYFIVSHPFHRFKCPKKQAAFYDYVGPGSEPDSAAQRYHLIFPRKNCKNAEFQKTEAAKMRRLTVPLHGFRQKCYCVNFSIIHSHLHNLFISQGFSHFPHDFPHCYVNSIFFKKCGICVGGRDRAAPVQRVPPHCPCSPTSIKITP